jgi:hypothetical protein
VVRRPPGGRRFRTFKAELIELEFVDKDIDYADGVLF